MAELADARDLKSREGIPRAGSNPAPATLFYRGLQRFRLFLFGRLIRQVYP